ncbi:hypothetical protein D9758_004191 [Tetrapyrgos nigripes]|uniref:Uncharacterized protein n=1 Tax=Tetrapyrgos nigripes TaxID=182062 RepID=A0A8H5GUH7_9AGAR|nr:hypothetical protein D9758_004191 [Tetrapyrgos nigripes]
MSVISESQEEDDKNDVQELEYPTTPVRRSSKLHPIPAAVVYDDSVNPLQLRSQVKAPHFGVLLTEHSDGGYRQWWVMGEKNIVRRLVSTHGMPGSIAKDKEMEANPAMATYRQVFVASFVTGVVVVFLMSFM